MENKEKTTIKEKIFLTIYFVVVSVFCLFIAYFWIDMFLQLGPGIYHGLADITKFITEFINENPHLIIIELWAFVFILVIAGYYQVKDYRQQKKVAQKEDLE